VRNLISLGAILVLAFAGKLLAQDPPFLLPSIQELQKLRSAVIETNRGSLYFELFPDLAPWHVANFKYLADKGFYRGLRFHYFYPGYIAQAGAPTADPDSGPGYSLPAEFSARPHRRGTLGMARVKDGANPERRSHGSQFHLLLRDSPHMDSRYTVFGELVHGFDVLERLGAQDRIEKVVVYVRESR
jgi:cyclophilin family peptidyl-prolyl cis-trans isomerase